mgnify:CR=1 FL=1
MMDMPPGWVPQPETTVDPQLNTDLSDVKEHPPTQEQFITKITDQLKEVYDPEISINIYDLGLIYDIDTDHLPKVTITHTLTSAFCPAADDIISDIEAAAGMVDGVDGVLDISLLKLISSMSVLLIFLYFYINILEFLT